MSQFQALVNIFAESPSIDEVVKALSKLDNLEQVYEVTGEFDIVAVVSAPDLDSFRDTLTKEIMKIKGVKSTVSSVVLDEHKILHQVGRRKKSAESPGP
ncbi:MAG: Lrp/AsnC ligand binding domain-containing protein [Thaumarchaeota archaeon]|nr:Lrp/AsnC ligand binding domain-containing protein [Nitrososphaerota archaeon]